MSQSLSATVSQQVKATLSNTLPLGGRDVANLSITADATFTTGAITKVYCSSGTASAAPVSLNLFNSSLVDPQNMALSFSSLTYLLVKNMSSGFSLTLFGGATPVIPTSSALSALGIYSVASTYTVNAGAAIIRLDPGANTVAYNILALGS